MGIDVRWEFRGPGGIQSGCGRVEFFEGRLATNPELALAVAQYRDTFSRYLAARVERDQAHEAERAAGERMTRAVEGEAAWAKSLEQARLALAGTAGCGVLPWISETP